MSGERWELVTDWASLRAGDLVEYRDCSWCHRVHRLFLMRLIYGPGVNSDGTKLACEGWTYEGKRCCIDCLVSMAVDRRVVYKVLIPPASASTDTSTRSPVGRRLERAR